MRSVTDLREFHRFLTEKLIDTQVDCSPEEALDEWRRQYPDVDGNADDLAAVREALEDLARGDRGIAFEAFDLDFRKRRRLPDSA